MTKKWAALFSVALCLNFLSSAIAATVTEETVVTPRPKGDTRLFDVMDIDLNHDKILSTNEVGEFLFKLYDADGNNIIDSLEYERKSVFTITPMAKETITTYDFNNDGLVDQQKYTYETFFEDTQLARFDQNRDGLSAHEFTANAFNIVDINNDHAIDLDEWRSSYIAGLGKKLRKESETNK